MSKPTTTIATEREIRENVVYKVNVLYYMQAYENYTNAKDHYTREFYYNAKEQYKRVIHELDYLVYGRLGQGSRARARAQHYTLSPSYIARSL